MNEMIAGSIWNPESSKERKWKGKEEGKENLKENKK